MPNLPNLANLDYVDRVNRAVDYVMRNLDQPLRLEEVARTWLPSSGYAPAHQPGFEAWNGRPFAHGMEYFELRAQLPIMDASVPL